MRRLLTADRESKAGDAARETGEPEPFEPFQPEQRVVVVKREAEPQYVNEHRFIFVLFSSREKRFHLRGK